MYDELPVALSALPVPLYWEDPALDQRLSEARSGLSPKIVVLDDDPTGVQTVHDVPVYTNWEAETLQEAFSGPEELFFILTNSRGMTAEETARQHKIMARRIVTAAEQTQRDYILISRSDSTLRGHYPLETTVLREEIEACSGKRFDAEIIYPFFAEGGRYTWQSVHYVLEGDALVPCSRTAYAQDKSFGYTHSYLPAYCAEKSHGAISVADVIRITLADLREKQGESAWKKLMSAKGFAKVVVDSLCYSDVKAFAVAFWWAVRGGKTFLFRSAAAVPKVLGDIADRPLLTGKELVAPGNRNGGIVLIGSHVPKTTRQLNLLQTENLPIQFLQFDQHRVLEKDGLRDEVSKTVEKVSRLIQNGETVVVYTRRDRLDLPDSDKSMQLKISVEISDALTSVVAQLPVRPRFIIAKGGITSSDVGVKALRVRKAMVIGQVRPGIPVWRTDPESKFPDMPYIIFPGNVGTDDDLLTIVKVLLNQ